MSIFEYNTRLHEENLKKEGYEDGREEGHAEGREEGRAEGRVAEREVILKNALQKGHTPEQIAEFIGVDLKEVLRVQKKLFQVTFFKFNLGCKFPVYDWFKF